jgi:transposase
MEHLAVDLGGRESQVCVRREDQEIIEERRLPTRSLKKYLQTRPRSRVILETCAESFHIAGQALELGHEVRVVPATLVRSLGVGARGIKTDKRDARVLSEVSCRVDLPSVHLPSSESHEIKAVNNLREVLVGCRTKMINSVRGWMRGRAMRIRSGATSSFPARVRGHFESTGELLPSYLQRQLLTIDAVNEQIAAADRDIKELADGNELCRRLMTVPGVGPVTSLRFVAVVDTIGRFPNAHAVQSYIGLTPGEHSSSDRKQRTSITKAGSSRLRWALVQAAWGARRCRAKGLDPMVRWSLQVESRRGKRIAVVALARKIAGVLYALWRDGSTYDPRQLINR